MKVEVNVEVSVVGGGLTTIIEVPDDATEADIAEAAADVFWDYCSYGYTVLED